MDAERRFAAEPADPCELRARAATYAFLSRALDDEDLPAEFFRALAGMGLRTGTELDAFAAGLAGLSADELDAQCREVAADHASGLLGMSADPVSPYESAHTSAGRLTMQDSRDEAVAAYAASGLARQTWPRLPEDHIAFELDFAGGLLARAAEETGEDPDRARRDLASHAAFVCDRLAPWVPGFADELEAHSATPFYRGVAQMLREFVRQEAELAG